MKHLLRSVGPSFALIAGLCIVAGSLFRCYKLDQPFTDEYSWRESSTAMMAKNFYRGGNGIFYPELDWGGPGPNYQGREFQTLTYLTAQAYRVFGRKEWVARGMVVGFALWGIFAFFQLVRRVWDPRRAAAAAAVLAILPGAMFTDRSFLPDPVMASLLVTALWMLVAYLQTDRRRYLLLATLIGTLGVLTKLNGLILGLPAVYAVWATFRHRSIGPRRWLLFGASAAFLLLAVVGYYLWAKHLSETYPPYHFAGGGKFLTPDTLSHWFRNAFFLGQMVWVLPWLLGEAALFLTVAGLLQAPAHRSPEALARGVFPWFFHFWGIALVVQYLVEAQHLMDDPYNMHLYYPFAAAFTGQALIALSDRIAAPARRTGALAVLYATLLFFGIQGSFYRFDHTKSYSAYALGRELNSLTKPGELAIVLGGNPLALYYANLRGWAYIPHDAYRPEEHREWDRTDVEELQAYREQGGGWVAIPSYDEFLQELSREELGRKYPDIAAYLFDNYAVVREGEHGIILRAPGE